MNKRRMMDYATDIQLFAYNVYVMTRCTVAHKNKTEHPRHLIWRMVRGLMTSYKCLCALTLPILKICMSVFQTSTCPDTGQVIKLLFCICHVLQWHSQQTSCLKIHRRTSLKLKQYLDSSLKTVQRHLFAVHLLSCLLESD